MIVLVDCYIKKEVAGEFSVESAYLLKVPSADRLEVGCTYYDTDEKDFHTYAFKSMYVDRDDVGGLGHMVIAPRPGAEQLRRLLATRDTLNDLFPRDNELLPEALANKIKAAVKDWSNDELVGDALGDVAEHFNLLPNKD
jgi:hypothetical protein